MNRRVRRSRILIAVGLAVAITHGGAAAARYPWLPAVVSECKDADSCPTDGDCTSEVRGCKGRSQCAECLCEETNCGCKCEDPSTAWLLRAPGESVLVAFDRADQLVTIDICQMKFDDFLTFLRDSIHPGWEIATTVTPVPETMLTWNTHWADHRPHTAGDMLADIAREYGVGVEINDKLETIVFFNLDHP